MQKTDLLHSAHDCPGFPLRGSTEALMGFLRLGAPEDTGAQCHLKRYHRSINDPSPSPTG